MNAECGMRAPEPRADLDLARPERGRDRIIGIWSAGFARLCIQACRGAC